MAYQVRVPTLGESVSEGTITRWAKQDGESITTDEVLLEIETDKASMEIPSEKTGVLKIMRPAGSTVQVGEVVAEIDEGAAPRATPPAAPARTVPKAAPSPAPAPAPAPAAAPPPGPAARHIAAERGIDTTAIAGSGKHGQVTKADVLAFQPKAASSPAPAPQAASAP